VSRRIGKGRNGWNTEDKQILFQVVGRLHCPNIQAGLQLGNVVPVRDNFAVKMDKRSFSLANSINMEFTQGFEEVGGTLSTSDNSTPVIGIAGAANLKVLVKGGTAPLAPGIVHHGDVIAIAVSGGALPTRAVYNYWEIWKLKNGKIYWGPYSKGLQCAPGAGPVC